MTPRPRILILSTAYLPLIGGSELAIRNIAERLPDYDFDLVTARYSPGAPAYEQLDHVHVYRTGSAWLRIPFLLPKNFLPLPLAWRAWRLTWHHHYTAVHAYQASQAAGAAWLLKLAHPKLPLVVTLQEGKDLDHQPWLMRMFRRLILREADRITAISSYLADYAHQQAPHTPVDIIPNGVSIREARHTPHNPDPTILTVSRLVPKNNVEGIIRALPLVRQTVTNARLAIAGDGPLREKLEALSRELGVRDVVSFMGTVPPDDLPTLYASADVFVRPSLSEGLGSAFLEAMAAGLPVVGSAVGGITDFLHHEETGLVCDPANPANIAEKLIRALTDTTLRERIAANASQLVHEKYDWHSVAAQMASVYERLS